MTFSDLGLIDPLLRALKEEGYEKPTPIQAQSIPAVLEGKDVFGCAQTGTGKTAAFALPILHKIAQSVSQEAPRQQPRLRSTHSYKRTYNYEPGAPTALILAPTRELAVQISESFASYGRFIRFKQACVYGGVSARPQIELLRRGVDVVVATPGRLIDLLEQQALVLDKVNTFVLDEADRMLDMGFITDIRRLIPLLPKERQTVFYSATVPAEIKDLSNTILRDPIRVEVTPVSSAVEVIEQKVYFVDKLMKKDLLNHLLTTSMTGSALIFTRTKRAADRVSKDLIRHGINAEALHGDKSQDARQRALRSFKSGQVRVLVATDIAARGIDVDSLKYVINYEMPDTPETFVHRVGRTGRAGASGLAVSLCDPSEAGGLRDIQKHLKRNLPVETDQPYHMDIYIRPFDQPNGPGGGGNGGGRPGGNRGGRSSYGGGGGRSGGGYGQRREGGGGYGQRREGGSGSAPRSEGGSGYGQRREGSPARPRTEGGSGYGQRREGGSGYGTASPFKRREGSGGGDRRGPRPSRRD